MTLFGVFVVVLCLWLSSGRPVRGVLAGIALWLSLTQASLLFFAIGTALLWSATPQKRLQYRTTRRTRTSKEKRYFTGDEQLDFVRLAFPLFSKVAQADGHITRSEIDSLEAYMQHTLGLNAAQRKAAIESFRQARTSCESIRETAKRMYMRFGNNRKRILRVAEMMLRVALADGELSPQEEAVILDTLKLHGFGWRQFEELKARVMGGGQYRSTSQRQHQRQGSQTYGPKEHYSYQILGLTPTCSNKEIKKQYRKLVKQHHPDVFSSQKVSQEFVKLATRRFQEIQNAYEEVCDMRGISH